MKRVLALILALLLLLPFGPAARAEEAQESRVVLGADLTNEQIDTVYRAFGVSRGSVTELQVTNAEERRYLEGYVEEAVIGTLSISSVYVQLLAEGDGMHVSTSNISWCTGEMYRSALATAGIKDARIVVAAPFAVSGTAALTGIYKAYEDMTGQELSDQAKDAGTQELTVTGQLAEEIGGADTASIVSELKGMLSETAQMSDEELEKTIGQIAEQYRVSLSQKQVQQLVGLCRALEGLDPSALQKRVEDVQNTLQKVSEAKDQVLSFADKMQRLYQAVAGFFSNLRDIFGGE